MIDAEKVINGLNDIGGFIAGRIGVEQARNFLRTIDDTIALLKEQDAVNPHYNARTNWYECGNCHYSMTSGMHCRSVLIPATKVRYCANCGFPVNWEGR